MSAIPPIRLLRPLAEDGIKVHDLIKRCPPLDTNSSYCNLLQCTHWSSTSVIAKQDNEVCGFVSGYQIPERTKTLFIWQVAVGEEVRGKGLAGNMILHLLERCKDVSFIETTITRDNDSSWNLFRSIAKRLASNLEERYKN